MEKLNETKNESPKRSNFIQAIIEDDLASGRHQQVVTRFPPEPNGYPHIGHAKSICLNFGLARDLGGRCHLRMDDTNPTTEDVEYVEALKRDVRWLGFEWGEHMYHASDYFEQLYGFAVGLIKAGKAYVCSLSEEEIRTTRGSLSEAGTPSPYRKRAVEENLDLLTRMRAGEFEEGAHVVRALIDMGSPNMKMRDPLIYRIKKAHHYRTGNDWCIYPLYDFAHCLSDSIEGITHSICTLEFENNRELYDWFIDNCDVTSKPRQYEFARLSLAYTIMSKRKLLKLVNDKLVDGWDDPRMPTISGMRRRGYTPEAIRHFCDMIGIAKANSTVDFEKLEYAVRNDLNHKAPRVMCVLDPLKVTLTNWSQDKVEMLDASLWPHDVPREGTRPVPFGATLCIERADFMENPPKKYRRLSPGAEVRLRYGYVIKCEEAIKDDSGKVVELRCSVDLDSRSGKPLGRKIKGTIHWVSAKHALPATVRLYDRLFKVEKPGAEGRDFLEELNEDSIKVMEALVEPSIGEDPAGSRYQFERQGYFISDSVDSKPGALVFNRVVGLRDSWAKKQAAKKAPEPAAPKAPKKAKNKPEDGERRRPQKRSRSYERDKARAENPALASRLELYRKEMKLDEDSADLLTGSVELGDFFEAALGALNEPVLVAKWLTNNLMAELKDASVTDLPFDGKAFGDLVKMLHAGTIGGTAAKEVLAQMVKTGQAPEAIVKAKGLEQMDDTQALRTAVESILAQHPGETERFKNGEKKLTGFFIGKVMKATGGKANPKAVRALIEDLTQ